MITKNTKTEWNVSGTNETILYGISSDTKPTDSSISNGAKFIEMDTKKTYLYDGASGVWRMWDNNSGSGEDSGVGLNVAGASVGQAVVVASVDSEGVPQSWTPITLVKPARVEGTQLILT